jgi:Mn-dependent DtxR family transcriptional regulator
MRRSAKWMSIWDDRILEYIDANEGASVGELADSKLIRVSSATVSRRCQRLADHGMLRPLGNGVYVITDLGVQYLNGEVDAGDLPEAEDADDAAQA